MLNIAFISLRFQNIIDTVQLLEGLNSYMAFITIWIASKIEVHPVTKNTIKLPCPFVKEKLYTFIIIIIISLFLKISLHPLEGLIW
ncbi:hypothetical protein CHH55_18585 [Niallia circulans]|nr:hypothetical protein CHH55_18585 [Niallia circulans]